MTFFEEAVRRIHAYSGGRLPPQKRGWTFLYSDRMTLGPTASVALFGRNPRERAMDNAADSMYYNKAIASFDAPASNGIIQYREAGDHSPFYGAVCNLFGTIAEAVGETDPPGFMDRALITNLVPFRSSKFSSLREADIAFAVDLWTWLFRQAVPAAASGPSDQPLLQPKVILCFSDERNDIERRLVSILTTNHKNGPLSPMTENRGGVEKWFSVGGKQRVIRSRTFVHPKYETALIVLPHPAFSYGREGWMILQEFVVGIIAGQLT